ncbi:MAG: alanine--tRNA ligase [Candidatus Micrarchaeia archaeon]
MGVKEELRAQFSREPQRHYEVALFKEKGFARRQCPKCGRFFWSLGKEVCGDSKCEPYSFFRPASADYIEVWRGFEKFFTDNGHASIPRYPVICRWRDDLYFTIASIVDFMRLEGGAVAWEYPENPLVVPQMCLRFNDIPNVGVTGRHFSCFVMAGQHSFNYPAEGYWKDRCIELNFNYLTRVLEIKPEELTYLEDVWAMPDLSSFGPCVETFANGLELVNSVFTEFTKPPGGSPRELAAKVIDVGWGFERLVWYAAGTPTAYDCAFGPVVPELIRQAGVDYDKELFLKYAALSSRLDLEEHADIRKVKEGVARELGVSLDELEKKIAVLEAIYAVADHARALAFAIADGGLPSNVGGGYNLRVVLRRALSFIDQYKLPFALGEVAEAHAKYLRPLFPELSQNVSEIHAILEVEERRYRASFERAKRLVSDLIEKGRLTEEKFSELYESHGVTPELAEEVAAGLGKPVEIPSDFYKNLTQQHVFHEAREEAKYNPEGLPKTRLLYYETGATACEASVVAIRGNALVLDQTCFYAEGGGQAPDLGTIHGKRVLDVQIAGGVVFHEVEDARIFTVNQRVRCAVDADRRRALARHHTATHVMAAAARAVLGNHVWQAGARKEPDKAHLDITHYEKISPEQLKEIERAANAIVFADKPVVVRSLDRGEAERRYGFTLYQGGGAPGKTVRVVDIEGTDQEACGGIHVASTGKLGLIKIIKEERIQDGVNRIEYCAGEAALAFIQEREALLEQAADRLKVPPASLPAAVERFFNEWKERGKAVAELEDTLAEISAARFRKEGKLVRKALDVDAGLLKKIALKMVEGDEGCAVVFANKSNDVVCAAGRQSGRSAKELLGEVCAAFGGGGGGSDRLAQGKTRDPVVFA